MNDVSEPSIATVYQSSQQGDRESAESSSISFVFVKIQARLNGVLGKRSFKLHRIGRLRPRPRVSVPERVR